MGNSLVKKSKPLALIVDLRGYHFGKKIPGEMESLVSSAGIKVVFTISGRCDHPSPETFARKGKVLEIRDFAIRHKVALIVFNHELSAVQQRNLEKIIGFQVIDRSTLILDIFAQRAKSHEGKLQVELAQLQHLSSRLIRGWTHLERQKGGIGLRGPGESQLETDRRLIGKRIKLLKTRIEAVAKRRKTQRRARRRNQVAQVSLIGYTNAGKSTMFNQLTRQSAYTADQLFATLDTTTRKLQGNNNGNTVLLSDTVGFIRDLPHQLIAAFRATLEEVVRADLLLHVVDSASDERDLQIDSVNKVLLEIGAEEVPQLIVFNKTDLSSIEIGAQRDACGKIEVVKVSAKTGLGLGDLQLCINELLSRTVSNGRKLDYSGLAYS